MAIARARVARLTRATPYPHLHKQKSVFSKISSCDKGMSLTEKYFWRPLTANKVTSGLRIEPLRGLLRSWVWRHRIARQYFRCLEFVDNINDILRTAVYKSSFKPNFLACRVFQKSSTAVQFSNLGNVFITHEKQ